MNLTLKHLSIDDFLKNKKIFWEFKQVNVLVGKNGSGKTSLLKIINTMLTDHDDQLSCMCLSGKVEILINEEPVKLLSNKMISDLSALDRIIKVMISKDFVEKVKNASNDGKISVTLNTSKSEEKSYFDEEKIKRFAVELSKKESLTNKRFTSVSSNNTSIESTTYDDYIKKINVEFISTVNLSSNSISQYISSDGNKKSTILDLEIDGEISKLISNDIEELNVKKFTCAINNFFKDSNKKIYYKEKKFFINLNNEDEITIQDLSSGERQLMYIFLKLINSSKNTIFLMDEPEISLHLEWQEILISEMLKVKPECQLIIVTHSPALVMNGWMDSYIDINDIVVS